MGRYRLAVDTGGTFSDFVLADQSTGNLTITKVPSTPADPGEAVINGIRQLAAEHGIDPAAIDFFIHGTTVATNALLEEKGARVGLLITAGFRGIYEVMDQAREYGPRLFDLGFEKPRPLVPPSRTFEIRERIGARGEVEEPLDEGSVAEAIAGLDRAGVEAVAICFLFSFLNPAHERRVAELCRRHRPEWRVTASADLLPQIREYYRLSTTLVNTYVAPKVAGYLERLAIALAAEGVRTSQRYVMQSNGGAATFRTAGERAVTTLLSGPAGGVMASLAVGRTAGLVDLITFDMGGTSCDVALVQQGEAQQVHLSRINGRHVAVPVLAIHTVSAGGGTLAWVDAAGGLHVGPESAGADPGPACYRRGGTIPTVTDADLVLGYLNPRRFLGGRMQLDLEAAGEVLLRHVARPLGVDVLEAALGVVEVVCVKMAEAVKAISTYAGYDLREFTLVAFGGAGPIHAPRIALDLGMPAVLVPPYPGVHSALGLLTCHVVHDYVLTRLQPLDALKPSQVARHFSELLAASRRDLTDEGFSPDQMSFRFAVDLRYAGQRYELTVPVAGPNLTREELATVRHRFDELHRQRHGHAAPTQSVDLVSYRVMGIGHVPTMGLPLQPVPRHGVEEAQVDERPAVFSGCRRAMLCPVYDRDRLGPGHRLQGPAIVEQFDATVVIEPGQTCRVDNYGNLIITTGGGAI